MVAKPKSNIPVQWLEVPLNNVGQISIEDSAYRITFVWDKGPLSLLLEPLRNKDTRQYHLTRTGRDGAWQCNCPDANFRRGRDCKHITAVNILLQQLVDEYGEKGGGDASN